MSYIEDRAFIYSMRDTLQRDFPLYVEENFTELASYYAFWNISDVLMLNGNNISLLKLKNILNGIDQSEQSNRVFAVKNAVEIMYKLSDSSSWNLDLIASMRGELDHFGGFIPDRLDQEIIAIVDDKDREPLEIASTLFLTLWNDGFSYSNQRSMAILIANIHLIKNGFVPVVITSEKFEELRSALNLFDINKDPKPFRDFIVHQEFTSIYNFLAYRINKQKEKKKELPKQLLKAVKP